MSATKRVTIDMAPLPAMLTQLRLPTIARLWQAITETADRESWPAAKTLAALFEHELVERAQRAQINHFGFDAFVREFVGGLATRILELKPGGKLVDFKGTYDEYLKAQGLDG